MSEHQSSVARHWLEDVRDAQLLGTIGPTFSEALSEIKSGEKSSHWMWYVFPQVPGLGTSGLNRRFAVPNINDATAFLTDSTTGPNFEAILDASVQQLELGISLTSLMGHDAQKFVSSVTLFDGVASHIAHEGISELAQRALARVNRDGYGRCEATRHWLAEQGITVKP